MAKKATATAGKGDVFSCPPGSEREKALQTAGIDPARVGAMDWRQIALVILQLVQQFLQRGPALQPVTAAPPEGGCDDPCAVLDCVAHCQMHALAGTLAVREELERENSEPS